MTSREMDSNDLKGTRCEDGLCFLVERQRVRAFKATRRFRQKARGSLRGHKTYCVAEVSGQCEFCFPCAMISIES